MVLPLLTPPTAMTFPSGANAVEGKRNSSPGTSFIVRICRPERSQRTGGGPEVTTRDPSGLNTAASPTFGSVNLPTSEPDDASHNRAVPSDEEVRIEVPSGLYCTLRTWSV